MPFHLACVHDFGKYKKSQIITDPDEIASLSVDREHHFVRISDQLFAPPVDPEPTIVPVMVDEGYSRVQPPPTSAKRAT